jgi:DNA-directed RNA polymerase beta subunit
MKMQDGVFEVDDIDHLKNKRVRSSGECLQEIFSIGFLRLEKSIRLKFNSSGNFFAPTLPSQRSSVRNMDQLAEASPRQSGEALPRQSGEASPRQSGEALPSQGGEALPSQGIVASTSQGGETSPRQGSETQQSTTKMVMPSRFPQSNQSGFRPGLGFTSAQQNSTFHLQSFLNTRPINGAFREFFGTHPLSQFMDQINPLAEITHKRRLTSLGPGGVSRDTATLAIRGIHPSHYGRICPIETPEGKNTGLVNSLTTYAKLSSSGLLKSPFYKILKNQIQKNAGVFFLDPEQEEHFKIATPDLNLTPLGFLPKSSIPVRLGKRFVRMKSHRLALLGISPLQMISVATSFIPFLEHDDANRALMGSNMQRQAVPILKPERPFLGTGLEARVISDSGHAVFAKKSGYVMYSSGSHIFIYVF